jgi:hypothetical protein
LEGVKLVGVSVENVRDAVVDTSLEPTVDVFSHVCKLLTVVVSDVAIGLSAVVADGVEMVVAPVFVSEQSAGVFLDERGQPVTGVVKLVGEMELFGELCHSSSASGSEMRVILTCAPVQRFGTIT